MGGPDEKIFSSTNLAKRGPSVRPDREPIKCFRPAISQPVNKHFNIWPFFCCCFFFNFPFGLTLTGSWQRLVVTRHFAPFVIICKPVHMLVNEKIRQKNSYPDSFNMMLMLLVSKMHCANSFMASTVLIT